MTGSSNQDYLIQLEAELADTQGRLSHQVEMSDALALRLGDLLGIPTEPPTIDLHQRVLAAAKNAPRLLARERANGYQAALDALRDADAVKEFTIRAGGDGAAAEASEVAGGILATYLQHVQAARLA